MRASFRISRLEVSNISVYSFQLAAYGSKSNIRCNWHRVCQRYLHRYRHPEEYLILKSDCFQHFFKNWQGLRQNKLTASTFGGAIGLWRRRRVQLWLEKIGAIEPFYGNLATCYSNSKEEEALEKYKLITGNTVLFPEFQVHDKKNPEDSWLAASPDGDVDSLVYQLQVNDEKNPDDSWLASLSDADVDSRVYELPSRGVLEIKCPFFSGNAGKGLPWKRIPPYYMPQAQGLLEIMDRDWMDYYVWTPNGSSLFRVYRDEEYWALLKIALSDFWLNHVQPAKEICKEYNITNPLVELSNLKPEPRHELCPSIVYGNKQVVDNSKLLFREIDGQLNYW